jgi:hypothetical protein
VLGRLGRDCDLGSGAPATALRSGAMKKLLLLVVLVALAAVAAKKVRSA